MIFLFGLLKDFNKLQSLETSDGSCSGCHGWHDTSGFELDL